MTRLATMDDYGVVTEPATLTIQRLLPGPVERVWAYLTDGNLRRKWLAGGDMELTVGAPFEFVWRNDELSPVPDVRPSGFAEEERMHSLVTEVDAPRRLSFTWQGSGDVTFALEEKGDDVLLTVIHRRLPDRATMLGVSAGWHMHLDVLTAIANDTTPPPFWSGWSRLRQDYERRLAG